ncbi:hypothetical protein TNCV_506601 [Trichonephila clavipes]|nr:hypothetical protein TNCV_506601 [Trichonephila clavipes]
MDSWLEYHDFKSYATEDKPRIDVRCNAKINVAQTSFLPVVWKLEVLSGARGLLGKDLVILSYGQVRRMTSELATPPLTITPKHRKEI